MSSKPSIPGHSLIAQDAAQLSNGDVPEFNQGALNVFQTTAHLRMSTKNMPIPAIALKGNKNALGIGNSEKSTRGLIGIRHVMNHSPTEASQWAAV